jgi:tRNA1(Val) A37 N6-methylase TrmN6
VTGETDDAFLGGRLHVWQPAKGYRAGTDAVLLAAAVQAEAGQAVLELGCGAGVVILCLAARVPGLSLTGVERHAAYADLARRNCARNDVRAEIVEADLRSLPPALKARSFDHVVANPPYLDRRHGLAGAGAARERAIAAPGPRSDWAAAGLRRLRPGGRLTMIAPAERLPELLEATGGAGVSVCPIAARAGREPDRILVSALKGGRARFRLSAPLVVHRGPAHIDDRADDYTPEVRAILREGAALATTLR